MDKRKSIFFPPKHKWLAEMITISWPACIVSAYALIAKFNELLESMERGNRRAKAMIRAMLRGILLAASRAKVSAKRKGLPRRTKIAYLATAKLYRRLYEVLSDWAATYGILKRAPYQEVRSLGEAVGLFNLALEGILKKKTLKRTLKSLDEVKESLKNVPASVIALAHEAFKASEDLGLDLGGLEKILG